MQFVSDNPLPRNVRTTWRWPSRFSGALTGSLVLEASAVPLPARIDGRGLVVPGVLQFLSAGSYTLLVSAEGYLPARATVEVLPEVTTSVRFDLEPAIFGYLYVASQPWGTVFVNGAQIGYTTIAGYRLSAGTHRVRIERPGYLPFDTTVTVQEREQRIRLGNIRLMPERP